MEHTTRRPSQHTLGLGPRSVHPIVVDGLTFQLQPLGGGISRLWRELLTRLAGTDLGPRIVLLDRAATAPPIEGIRRVSFPRFEWPEASRREDARRLGAACASLSAACHVSTYHTCADGCRNVVMLYDFIPEALGWDLSAPEWRLRRESVERADRLLAISRHTADDFHRFHDVTRRRAVNVIPLAASERFQPRPAHEIDALMRRYGIRQPYYLSMGHRPAYKNVSLFLRGLRVSGLESAVDVVFTGGAEPLEAEFVRLAEGARLHHLRCTDDELAAAYTGAAALVYPSRYEGFGLPIAEAMACGCPVITTPLSSIPEVAGDAAIYVEPNDVLGMARALTEVRDVELRGALAEAGRAQAQRFSWSRSAGEFARVVEAFISGAGHQGHQPVRRFGAAVGARQSVH